MDGSSGDVTSRLFASKTRTTRKPRHRVSPAPTMHVVSHSTSSNGLCRLPPLGNREGSGRTPPLDKPRTKRFSAAAPAPVDPASTYTRRMPEPEPIPDSLYAKKNTKSKSRDFGEGHPSW